MTTVAAPPVTDEAYAVRRTQAMPKNSLFGTSLEIQDENVPQASAELEGTKPRTIEVPDHLKPLLQKREALDSQREEVQRQKLAVRQSKKDLKSLESKALTFAPDPKTTRTVANSSKSKHSHVDKTHQWFTKKDIEHVKDVNIGGFGNSGSYNRDKYSRRAPTHSYSQMGDLLQPGMEFTPRHEGDSNQNGNFETSKPRLRTNITNNNEIRSECASKQPAARSVVALPPNIRHMFGSKVCDDLLSDEQKVNYTLAKQERVREPPRRGRRERTPDFKSTCTKEYSGLSNATRQNVFPGYTADHKISTTKTVYNDSIFNDRYAIPDEYRYQRDELSTWCEQHFLRQHMDKHWLEYFNSLAKPVANWDRSAKRQRTVENILAKPKPKPKTKQKAKAVKEEKPSSPFEPVEFKTPPITPPPAPAPLPKPEKFERDDDFWDFYNQSVPD